MKTRSLVVVISALALVSDAWAKPVYLTVPRAYSTDETPILDLAFQGKAPVELRVLKPVDLEAFLKSQANLRRAYSPVNKEENPAAYLWKGINQVNRPEGLFLDALSPEFRMAANKKFPPRTFLKRGASSGPLARFGEEREVMISMPPNTRVVDRQWVNLDLGGAQQDYSVPGFDAWFASEEGVQERRVALNKLPAGVYIVQLLQGAVEGQVTLLVTDLTVQVRQTDDQVLVRVAGVDKRPKPGAKVIVRSADKTLGTATTNDKGEALLTDITEPRLLISAQLGDDVAIVDTDFFSTLAVTPDVFLYTDRPIYKPGNTVNFKGILREPGSAFARLFFPSSRKVEVFLDRGDNEITTSITASVDKYGTFSGKLDIPDDLAPGLIRVRAMVNDRPHASEARVQDYVKPTFYVEVTPDQENINPGQSISGSIRVRRYSGGAPPHTRYEVFLYRTRVDTPAWVDDSGMGAKGSSATYGGPATNEATLSVPELLSSSIQDRASSGELGDDPWESAPTFNGKGEATYNVGVPPLYGADKAIAWKYSLVVRARDAEGALASSTRPYYLSPVEVMGQLSVNTRLMMPDGEDPAVLSVRAVSVSGAPYHGASGSVEYKLENIDGSLDNVGQMALEFPGIEIARVKLPTSPKAGRLHAYVTLLDRKGGKWTGDTSVLVAGKPGEPVAKVVSMTAEALSTVVDVDEKARLIALLPKGWGPGGQDQGNIWVTLSGPRIHDTQMVTVDGNTLVHAFDVEERFGSAVHAQLAMPGQNGRWETQSVAFRILPTRKVLTVDVQPAAMEALPMTEQTLLLRVTDHRGEGVPASVSISVVDKAVLAVQPEFRPAVLDFFYPLQRNNAADFFSADFQGYGYGELLARKLLRRGFDFAAIKSPTKLHSKDERDTAHWNASVVTDGDGRATVTFKLPSNQTLWNVSAVAADTNGRFGEGKAEFAARTGFSVATALPQFLRAGDQVRGTVRLSNTEKTSRENVEVALDAGDGLAALQKKETVLVGAKNEFIWAMDVSAEKQGQARVAVQVRDGTVSRADVREFPIHPGAASDVITVGSYGDAPAKLVLPDGAKVSDVSLTLMPGVLQAALANIQDLMTYPHGCVEQLVATTIPNIAVMQTVQAAGGLGKIDPTTRTLLEEAEARARTGIDRILGHSVKGGGFGWFDGEAQPNLALTLIALDGLSYAVEAKLISSGDSRLTPSIKWLEGQADISPAMKPLRVYVLSRLQHKKAAPLVRQALDDVGNLDTYGAALIALAAEHAGIHKESEVQEKLAAVVGKTRDGMLVAWNPADRELLWQLPIRPLGVTAIAAHAASRHGQIDPARVLEVRKTLMTALARRHSLSTFERSTLLLHSRWLIEREVAQMQRTDPPRVKIDGNTRSLSFKRTGGGMTAVIGTGPVGEVAVEGFDGAFSVVAVGSPGTELEFAL